MVTRSGTKHAVRGAMTALVTPFRDGEIDWAAVDELVDRQIESGIQWVVPCGTTGESPTLTGVERQQLIERVVERVSNHTPVALDPGAAQSNRCLVMAGTGSNSTAETIKKTMEAQRLGADAAMLVAPYYNRPPQEGLFRHFAAVAEAMDLPLVLYNVPGRTGVNISNDVVVRLTERFDNIVAIKDATGTVDNVSELASRCKISVLCGDDVLAWPMIAAGAVGLISVVSNLVPDRVSSLVRSALAGDMTGALTEHRRVFGLASGLAEFGPNPIPIKTAMAALGLIAEEFRLPLCPVPQENRKAIKQLLSQHEVTQAVHA